jgi:hypothetical protein
MEIRIPTSWINATDTASAMTEIEANSEIMEMVRSIAKLTDTAIGDMVEAVAQHIVTTDEDYVYDSK